MSPGPGQVTGPGDVVAAGLEDLGAGRVQPVPVSRLLEVRAADLPPTRPSTAPPGHTRQGTPHPLEAEVYGYGPGHEPRPRRPDVLDAVRVRRPDVPVTASALSGWDALGGPTRRALLDAMDAARRQPAHPGVVTHERADGLWATTAGGHQVLYVPGAGTSAPTWVAVLTAPTTR